MIFSDERKLILSGWLQNNNNTAYCSPLCLQKYLFFYEAFCKIENKLYDFNKLKGYIRGPVFSTVWGDYTKNRDEFNEATLAQYGKCTDQVDNGLARRASFIVSILSEKELSQLTHKYNIWNTKFARIMSGEQQVELSEQDFSREDYQLTRTLEIMYPDALVDGFAVFSIGEKNFLFSRNDIKRLTEQHVDAMSSLVEQVELQNPIFAEIDESGGLVID